MRGCKGGGVAVSVTSVILDCSQGSMYVYCFIGTAVLRCCSINQDVGACCKLQCAAFSATSLHNLFMTSCICKPNRTLYSGIITGRIVHLMQFGKLSDFFCNSCYCCCRCLFVEKSPYPQRKSGFVGAPAKSVRTVRNRGSVRFVNSTVHRRETTVSLVLRERS